MEAEPRIRQLLVEILDSNRSAQEVCQDSPDLLPEVLDQLRRMRGVEAELSALFTGFEAALGTGDRYAVDLSAELPIVPGYQVEELIGRGGMGMVYKARHLKLDRTIALKMIISGLYVGKSDNERFLREARAMASLRHPHIVPVYDVGEFDSRRYFTMEFMEGGNLAEALAGAPQPARASADLVCTLAGAVQTAHESGIVHRDLKPANILLSRQGSPKIADFGLARRFESDPILTLSGARVGTPSYMAPEQAVGKSEEVGPGADVYSLGAILYEMLTGRPPFRAENAMETERLVLTEEPVPPSRLNPKLPRNLETICLTCLHKSPLRRYASAAELEQELRRFLNGEPIKARPIGSLERSTRWVLRRPAAATAVVAGLLLALTLGGGGVWIASERAGAARGAERELNAATDFQRRSAWTEAKAALDRSRVRLGEGGPVELRRRLLRAERDQELAGRLEAIRLDRSGQDFSELGYWRNQYEHAFQDAGLGTFGDDPNVVAQRIRESNILQALVAALDDWTLCNNGNGEDVRLAWLLEVARKADSDPTGWRDRFRDPKTWTDRAALDILSKSVNVESSSVSVMVLLAERLRRMGGDPIPLLERVQRAHPDEFWANYQLGYSLLGVKPIDAVRYLQAALSLRRHAMLYNQLGVALRLSGRNEESIPYLLEAVALDPQEAVHRHNLGNALAREGKFVEALEQFNRMLELEPENIHGLIGSRDALFLSGRADDARKIWRRIVELDPVSHQNRDGYAELCLFLGEKEEYHRSCRDLLDRFSATTDSNIAERTARACLLSPATDEVARGAAALIDRALADEKAKLNGSYPYFLFAKGLSEYRQRRSESSITILTGESGRVMGPAPLLVRSLALHDLGKENEAIRTLAVAVISFDWSATNANNQHALIYHILRREAEAALLPRLAELLEGGRQPQSNAERLALLGICQFEGRWLAAASLYTDAFEVEPKLAENPSTRIRVFAARSACLAAAGHSVDAAKLGDLEKAQWRSHARAWLRAELESFKKLLDRNEATNRQFVEQTLSSWRLDDALAGIRDADEIEKMPEVERRECQVLWSEVETVWNSSKDAK